MGVTIAGTAIGGLEVAAILLKWVLHDLYMYDAPRGLVPVTRWCDYADFAVRQLCFDLVFLWGSVVLVARVLLMRSSPTVTVSLGIAYGHRN